MRLSQSNAGPIVVTALATMSVLTVTHAAEDDVIEWRGCGDSWGDGDSFRFCLYSYQTMDGSVEVGTVTSGYDNGKPVFFGQLEFKKKQGYWIEWYRDGWPACLGAFDQDKPDGDWICWYPGLKPRFIGKYRAGARIGGWFYYRPEGSFLAVGYCGHEDACQWVLDRGDGALRPSNTDEVRSASYFHVHPTAEKATRIRW